MFKSLRYWEKLGPRRPLKPVIVVRMAQRPTQEVERQFSQAGLVTIEGAVIQGKKKRCEEGSGGG